MQLKDYKDMSSWRIHDIVIQANEVYELDLVDTLPNQFVLQNSNDERLLIGISKMPTENNYEYEITKNTTRAFGRPTRTNKLYILNTGGVDVTVKVFSVFKEFDIACLTGNNVSIEHAEISTTGIVNGFKSGVELPSGDNHIGGVNVNNFSDLSTTIEDILSDSDASMQEYLKNNIVTGISNINSALSTSAGRLLNLTNSFSAFRKKSLPSGVTAYYKNNATENLSISIATNGAPYNSVVFEWFMNDSDDDITILVGSDERLTIKAHEKVTDLCIEVPTGSTLKTTCDNPLFRTKYYYDIRG